MSDKNRKDQPPASPAKASTSGAASSSTSRSIQQPPSASSSASSSSGPSTSARRELDAGRFPMLALLANRRLSTPRPPPLKEPTEERTGTGDQEHVDNLPAQEIDELRQENVELRRIVAGVLQMVQDQQERINQQAEIDQLRQRIIELGGTVAELIQMVRAQIDRINQEGLENLRRRDEIQNAIIRMQNELSRMKDKKCCDCKKRARSKSTSDEDADDAQDEQVTKKKKEKQ